MQEGITKREFYQRLRGALLTERSSYEDHWRNLSDFILPRRSRFFVSDRNKGDRRNQRIIDSTATQAARTLQSGMHSGITSPARPWFRLSTRDPKLAKFGPVKSWLHQATQAMYTILAQSNVYNALPLIYGDMGVFGTSAMSAMDDGPDFLRCYPYPIGSYALGISKRQIVDTCIRDYQMTVRQLVDEFGEANVSQTVKTMYDRGDYEQAVDVCWVVMPNPDADENMLESKYLPFSSCWFEVGRDDGKILRESGFNEFPILAPRWAITAEDYYGTDSPGMVCLGDVRQLQVMQKKKGQAVEKIINPPVQGPSGLRNQKVSLLPGDITYLDVASQQQGLRSVYDVRIDISHLREDIGDTRFQINSAFFVQLFLMLATSDSQNTQKTAREIQERHEEKLLMLGPVLERTNDELLNPMIDRVFAMMSRGGLLPPAPEEIQGENLKVEYISLMAQAQKLVGLVGVDRFLASTVPLAEVYPLVRYKIRAEELVNEYAELTGINPDLVVPDDEAMAAYDADRQAAKAQQQAEQMNLAAKSAKDLSGASMDGNNALSQMVEGVTP